MFTTLQHTLYMLSSAEKISKTAAASEQPRKDIQLPFTFPSDMLGIDPVRYSQSDKKQLCGTTEKVDATFEVALQLDVQDTLNKISSVDEALIYRIVDSYMMEHIANQLTKFIDIEASEEPPDYTPFNIQWHLDKYLVDVSDEENKLINDYFVECLVLEVNARVFQILDTYWIDTNEYEKKFTDKSFAVFCFILSKDFHPKCEGSLREVWDSFFPEADRKEINLRVRVCKAVNQFVREFLKPYRNGTITEETEDKKRAPLVVSLSEKLIQNFPNMFYSIDQIEDWATEAYIKEGVEFICDQIKRLNKPFDHRGYLENPSYKREINSCCEAIYRAMRIDFRDNGLTLRSIKEEVYFYLSKKLED